VIKLAKHQTNNIDIENLAVKYLLFNQNHYKNDVNQFLYFAVGIIKQLKTKN
jgi:hypothetical protein